MERMKRKSTIDYLTHICQKTHHQLHLLEDEKARMEENYKKFKSYSQEENTSFINEYIEYYKGKIIGLDYSIKLTQILIESITSEMRAWNNERKLADMIDKDRGFDIDMTVNDRGLNDEEVANKIKEAIKEVK